jgi:hypothetical protein
MIEQPRPNAALAQRRIIAAATQPVARRPEGSIFMVPRAEGVL